MADPPVRPRVRFPSRPELVTGGIGWVQEAIYIAVGVLLAIAGILVIVGTVDGVIKGIEANHDAVLIGLLVLDRVLLLLIVAELLHTLALVLYEGEIHAEPFLLVGLIAVVRRVVVITAKVEQIPSGQVSITSCSSSECSPVSRWPLAPRSTCSAAARRRPGPPGPRRPVQPRGKMEVCWGRVPFRVEAGATYASP